MKKFLIPAFALMMMASCGGNKGGATDSSAANGAEKSEAPAVSAEPSAEQVKAVWASYMDDNTTLPTVFAKCDIDKDGKPEYIHWRKDEPLMTVCTFDAKNGLTLVAANNFEPKELVIVNGAGVREGIGTMTFQQETFAVIKDSKLAGIYYWTADVDEDPSKFMRADAIRTLGKEVSKADFDAATKAFDGNTSELSFDDLEWQDWK